MLQPEQLDRIIKRRRIAKKELCQLLGYYTPDGQRLLYDQLQTLFFSGGLAESIGLTPDLYRRTRIFSIPATRIILGRIQIDLLLPKLKILLH